MSTTISLPFTLQAPPKNFKPQTFTSLSEPSTSQSILPTGPAFHHHARRILNQRSFEEDDKAEKEALIAKKGGVVEEEEDLDEGLGDEKEDKELLASDPKLWKQQDHYAVLGLQSLRYKATEQQVLKAHRRKVLRHHPDKKASQGADANDDSFFKCIAKAMEVLSSPEKRRQFDSVDPALDDDDFPSEPISSPAEFVQAWGPVFEREGRFSKAQPVPSIGAADASKDEVERFYDFWYSVDSWRSFEYLDKDSPEGADSRDEKRHQEKKNKSERAKRKKEDITRVRTLVDKALASDPRLKAFKAAEKAAKEAKKNGGVKGVDEGKKKEEEAKKAQEEAEKKAEEEKKALEDKASREAAKKAKASALKNVKKDRKAISAAVVSHNYFVPAGTSPSPATVGAQLTELDLLFEALEPEETAALKAAVEGKKSEEVKKEIVKAAQGSSKKEQFKEFA